MKTILVEFNLEDDEKAKRRALKTVCTLSGINFISVDMKGKKMTVIGTVDPIKVVTKLRKYWEDAVILSAGPLPEPEKKEEPKKVEPKKDEPKNDAPKKEEPKKEEPKEEPKKEEEKKEDDKKVDPPLDLVKLYSRPYYPPMSTIYHAPSMEENPNACVIL